MNSRSLFSLWERVFLEEDQPSKTENLQCLHQNPGQHTNLTYLPRLPWPYRTFPCSRNCLKCQKVPIVRLRRGTFQDCNIAKNVQRAWVKLKSSLPLPQTQRMFVQRLAAPTRSTSQCGQTLTFHANQSWRDRIYPRSRGRWRKTWTVSEEDRQTKGSPLRATATWA